VALIAATYGPCRRCRRKQPHDSKGRCMACQIKARGKRRQDKGVRIGTRQEQPAALRTFGLRRTLADRMYSVALRAEQALGFPHGPRDYSVAHEVGCEMCGAYMGMPESLQCAHGWSRGANTIRYHSANTFGLCWHCHHNSTPTRTLLRTEHADIGARWLDWCTRAVGAAAWQQVCAAKSASTRALDLAAVMVDATQRVGKLPPGEVREWALGRLDAIAGKVS
jgi:hypothetical protein